VTGGGVDNIGAAKKYPKGKTAGPATKEKMEDRRVDAENARKDDAAPWGMRDDPSSTPNSD
jgi:hypothetical protein